MISIKMKVLFDAYELVPGAGKSFGIYNYAKNLFRGMSEIISVDVELIVVCSPPSAADFTAAGNDRVRTEVLGSAAPSKVERIFWLSWRAALTLRQLGADVYFSPKGFLPIGIKALSSNIKTVVTVHDLIPFWYADKYPGYFGRLELLMVNKLLARSVLRSDRVIAISGATALDITSRLGRSGGISIVQNGVPYSPPRSRLFDAPYLFAITSRLPHKNACGVLAAYRAYRALVRRPYPLIVCGIDDPGEDGVMAVRDLSDAALHSYYAYAEAFLFLSLIEGFGFPPVEAMAHGTPVVCSDIPSLREVTGGLAVFVSPEDPQAAAAALVQVLHEKRARRIDAKAARQLTASYSWDKCARGVLDVLVN